jgi:hypothetical protein
MKEWTDIRRKVLVEGVSKRQIRRDLSCTQTPIRHAAIPSY